MKLIRSVDRGQTWSAPIEVGRDRSLPAVDPDTGRYVVKNSINWVFVTVDDAPLVVRSVTEDDGGLLLALSDGTREPLAQDTLRLDGDDVPYCDVRAGRLPARFTPRAAFALLELLGPAVHSLRRVPRGAGAVRR